jgi:hypothetical protein
MTFTEANRIGEKCVHMEGFACKPRDEFRECDRPLCCGFCPIVDNCESVCSKLREEWLNGNCGQTMGEGILD